ncbi:ESPR-type extended signal peptide-containing protein, partial [Gallibacterium salpingitidis]
MNHIFRVIFDKTRGIFVAVSELTKSHGKEKSEKQQSRDVVTNMLGGGEFDSSLTSKNPTYFSSQNKKVKFFKLSPLAVTGLIAVGVVAPWTDAFAAYDSIDIDCGSIAPDDQMSGCTRNNTDNFKEYVIALNPLWNERNYMGTDTNKVGVVASYGIAVGVGAKAQSTGDIVFGTGAWSWQDNTLGGNGRTIVIGANDGANRTYARQAPFSVVIGSTAHIGEESDGDISTEYYTKSVLIGAGSSILANPYGLLSNRATSGQGVVIGSSSVGTSQATAVGNNVYAVGRSSIALGSDDVETYKNVITEYDVEHYFKQLYGNIDANGTIYGWKVAKSGSGSSATYTVGTGGDRGKTIYSPTLAQGDGSIAIGSRSLAYASGSTAVGTLAFALKKGSTAIGTETRSEGVGSIALGSNSYVFTDNSIAAGNRTQVLGTGSAAYGYSAFATGENSLAMGTRTYANTNITLTTEAKQSFNVDDTIGDAGRLENAAKSLLGIQSPNSNYSSTTYLQTLETVFSNDNLLKNFKANYADADKQRITDAELRAEVFANSATSEQKVELENLAKQKATEANDLDKDAWKKETYLDPARGEVIGKHDNLLKAYTLLVQNKKLLGVAKSTTDNTKDAKNAVAIGSFAMAVGDNSLALGRGTSALKDNALSVGTYAAANGKNAVAFGVAARALKDNSMALGTAAASNGEKTLAIGSGAVSYGDVSMVVGSLSNVRQGSQQVALLGSQSQAKGYDIFALGNNMRIVSLKDLNSLAQDLKNASDATAKENVKRNYGLTENIIAQGNLVTVGGNTRDSIVVGARSSLGRFYMENTPSDPYAETNIYKQITSTGVITDYTANTRIDCVAGCQWNDVNANIVNGIVLGTNSHLLNNSQDSMLLGTGSFMRGTDNILIGNNSRVIGFGLAESNNQSQTGSARNVVLGNKVVTSAGAKDSIAIGTESTIGNYSISFNGNVQSYSLALLVNGVITENSVDDINTVENTAGKYNIKEAMALGNRARVYNFAGAKPTGKSDADYYSSDDSFNSGYRAMAMGANARAYVRNSVALGVDSVTDYTLEQLKKKAWVPDPDKAIYSITSPQTGYVSIGSVGRERRLVNVAAGAEDTDAVTVAQLKELDIQVQDKIDSLGKVEELHFLSVNKAGNEAADGTSIANDQKLVQNYRDYVTKKSRYLTYRARKDINKETFDADALEKMKAEIEAIESANTTFKSLASNLNAISFSTNDDIAAVLRSIATAAETDGQQTPTQTIPTNELDASNYNNNTAKANGSIALGYKAAATTGVLTWKDDITPATFDNDVTKGGVQGIAIGVESAVNAKNAIALGTKAKARAENSISIGMENVVGNNKNVSGTGDKDIDGKQSGMYSIALGYSNKVTGSKSIAIGTGLTVKGSKSGAFGDPTSVDGDGSYSIGNGNQFSDYADDTMAMGNDNKVNAKQSVVLGNSNKLGYDGNTAKTPNENLQYIFVLGNGVTANADHSVYLGDKVAAIDKNDASRRSAGITDGYASFDYKYTPTGGSEKTITFSNFAGDTPVGVVTIGSTTEARRLQGVAAGLIASTSTDAINGSQLYSVISTLQSNIDDAAQAATDAAAEAAKNVGTVVYVDAEDNRLTKLDDGQFYTAEDAEKLAEAVYVTADQAKETTFSSNGAKAAGWYTKNSDGKYTAVREAPTAKTPVDLALVDEKGGVTGKISLKNVKENITNDALKAALVSDAKVIEKAKADYIAEDAASHTDASWEALDVVAKKSYIDTAANTALGALSDDDKVELAIDTLVAQRDNLNNAVAVKDLQVVAQAREITDGRVDNLEDKIGVGPINGVDGQDGADGRDLADGKGVPGANGHDGAAGRDGMDGTSLNAKVQGLRDGIAGTVVYTDKQGNRLLVENGQYYHTKLVTDAHLEKANDGLWYNEDYVTEDGQFDQAKYDAELQAAQEALKAAGAAEKAEKQAEVERITALRTGKSLKDLSTAGGDAQKVAATDVILSTVNADGTTTSPITLANLADNLQLQITEEDIQAQAMATYNADKTDEDKVTTYEALVAKLKAAAGDSPDEQAKAVTDALTRAKAALLEDSKKKALYASNTVGQLLNLDTNLDRAVTLKDLQTVALAGLTFAGDTGSVQRSLSQTLRIIGTVGYITTSASGDAISIDLVQSVKDKLANLADNANNTYVTKAAANADATVVYVDADGNRLTKLDDGKYYTETEKAKVSEAKYLTAAQVTELEKDKTLQGFAGKGWYKVDGTGKTYTKVEPTAAERDALALVDVNNTATDNEGKVKGLISLKNVKENIDRDAVKTKLATAAAEKDYKPGDHGDTPWESFADKEKLISTAKNNITDDQVTEQAIDDLVAQAGNLNNAVAVKDLQVIAIARELTEGRVDKLADKIGTGPINGVDGATGKDGQSIAGERGEKGDPGAQGIPGASGKDGATGLQGPAGHDGQNGTTFANKIQSLRDGVAGTVVYTDTEGNRLLAENGEYYKVDLVKGKVKANDGLWYDKEYVNLDGSLTDAAVKGNVKGQSLRDIAGGDDYKNSTNYVAAKDVILSTVNADGQTTSPITLANLADNLKVAAPTDAEADAKITDGFDRATDGLGLYDSLDALKEAAVGSGGAADAAKAKLAELRDKASKELKADRIHAVVEALLTQGTDLDHAVTLKDLQTVALEGLSFAGNNGETIRRSLSETLNIKGEGVNAEAAKTFESAAGNINVINTADDTLTIQLAKALTGISSITGEKTADDEDPNNGKAYTPAQITLTEGSTTKAGGEVTGTTLPQVNVNGAKVTGVADGDVSETSTDAITGKQLHALKDALGMNGADGASGADGRPGPAGKDGLDGKSILDKVEGLRDGIAGTVVYTTQDGERLVRAGDGKLYTQSDAQALATAHVKYLSQAEIDAIKEKNPSATGLEGAAAGWYAVNGNAYTATTPADSVSGVAEVAEQDAILSTVNADGTTTKPITLANLMDNLVLPSTGTLTDDEAAAKELFATAEGIEADNVNNAWSGLNATQQAQYLHQAKAAGLTAEKAQPLVTSLLGQSTNLDRAVTLSDLRTVAMAGLNFAGDNYGTDSTKLVRRSLSQTLNIKGTDGYVTTAAKASDDGEVLDTIQIDLADSIKNKLDNLSGDASNTYVNKLEAPVVYIDDQGNRMDNLKKLADGKFYSAENAATITNAKAVYLTQEKIDELKAGGANGLETAVPGWYTAKGEGANAVYNAYNDNALNGGKSPAAVALVDAQGDVSKLISLKNVKENLEGVAGHKADVNDAAVLEKAKADFAKDKGIAADQTEAINTAWKAATDEQTKYLTAAAKQLNDAAVEKAIDTLVAQRDNLNNAVAVKDLQVIAIARELTEGRVDKLADKIGTGPING